MSTEFRESFPLQHKSSRCARGCRCPAICHAGQIVQRAIVDADDKLLQLNWLIQDRKASIVESLLATLCNLVAFSADSAMHSGNTIDATIRYLAHLIIS